MNASTATRVDLDALDRQLLGRLDDLMRHLGIEGQRGPHTWEGGPKGARITVALSGKAAGAWGAWSQHATGRSLVGLIAWARRIEFGPAIGAAQAFLGGKQASSFHAAPAATPASRDDSAGIGRARRIARRFRPVAGPGERYLIEHRSIPCPEAGWPSAIGYDPVECALAAVVRDPSGGVVAIHRVFVTPDGRKIDQDQVRRRGLRNVKQTDGPRSRGALVLGSRGDGQLLGAEGLETGLAMHVATGSDVLVALGPFSQLRTLPANTTSIIFGVEDHPEDNAAKATQATVQRFADTGISVSIATPWPERRGQKHDLADTMQAGGPDAVRARIAAAEPVYPTTGASLAQVRDAMEAGISRWVADTGPRHLLVSGEPGSGKSAAAHALPLADIVRRKAAGEPHRILLLVPDHELAAESRARLAPLAAQASEAGLTAAVLLGYGNLDKPVTPASPCQNLPAVVLALSAGQSPRQAVCGPSAGGDRCAHFNSCPRLASHAAAEQADIVIAATTYGLEGSHMPAAVRAGVQRAIIDEDLVGHAISAGRIGLETFTPLPLQHAPVLDGGEPDAAATDELQTLHARLVTAAAATGYLTAQALGAAGLSADDARRARAQTWDRKRPVAMRPGMPLEDRRRAAAGAGINGQLGRIAAVWHAVEDILTAGDAATGRIRIELEPTRDRGPARVLVLAGMKSLAPWLLELPLLLLDGTGDVDRVRRVLPQAEKLAVPKAAAAHHRMHLILGSAGASAMRSPQRQADLLAFMTSRMALRDKGLLVTHKSAAPAFSSSGLDLAVAHHGAIAGRDGHRDVRFQFVTAGRSLPPDAAAELAAAMTGEAVPIAERVRIAAPVQLRDGSTVMSERMGYADPRAMAAHDSIYYADMGQAVGRGRGVLRTAATPLDTFIFASSAPPGMVFDTVTRWVDARPDCIDAMMQAGIVTESPSHAALVHPGIFFTVKAAEQRIARAVARTRSRFGLPPDMTTAEVVAWRVQRQGTAWGQAWTCDSYQRAGQGHAPATVHAPLAAMALTRRVAALALGPLTWASGAGEVVPTLRKESYREVETTSRGHPAVIEQPIVQMPALRLYRADRPPDG